MSELPNGWVSSAINDLIALNPKDECADETEIGFVPMQLLGTQYKSKIGFERKKWGEVKKGYTHFADGDVLLAKITPCFENGKAGLVSGLPNGLGTGSTEYFVCRPHPSVLLPEYLLAFFKTQDFLRNGEVGMTGSVGHKRVPKDYLLQSEIPLPPLNEQKRIAAKLDALLERVDACRARLERVPLLLKRFRQAVLAAATSGQLTEDWRNNNSEGTADTMMREIDPTYQPLPCEILRLTELPQGWVIAKFGSLVKSIRGGTTAVPQSEPTNFPVLRSSSVRPGYADLTDIKYLAEQDSSSELNYLSEGDLLFTRLSGSLDYVANCAKVRNLNAERIQYPDRLFRAKVTDLVNVDYCELVFASPLVRAVITEQAKSSAGHQRVSISDIINQPIPVPPLAEQHEIVRRVETLFAYADRLEARYQQARAEVERLTPALLAKAFRGELVPQDPNDEPAAALLARLQDERAAATTAPPRSRSRTAAPAAPVIASVNGSTAQAVRLPFDAAREPDATTSQIQDDAADSDDSDAAPAATATTNTAKAATNGHRIAPPDIDEFDRETQLATLREVFPPGTRYDADTAIRTVAHTLGYARTGARIHERLKNTLRVAVQRGILVNESGEYRLDCRTIHDYPRELLLQAFLAAMGRAWITRDEAIRLAARYLGFRRTGSAIQEAFKSIINGAIRRDLVETDRELIRKL